MCVVSPDLDCPPAAYYYITYTTIELFASSLTAKTKLKVRRLPGLGWQTIPSRQQVPMRAFNCLPACMHA